MKTRNTMIQGQSAAFTLVEIVIAIGVVSFSILAVFGTLPVGLENVRDAGVQIAKANISRELRGELQQISYAATAGSASPLPTALASLSGSNRYYSPQGMALTGSNNAYYEAKFAVTSGEVVAEDSSHQFHRSNANRIIVTLSYPLLAPKANQKHSVFTLFVARQKMN